VARGDVDEVPRTDGGFDRFQERVLADALEPAEDERVVDLFVGPLHAMSEPRDDVIRVVGIDIGDVFEPACRLTRLSRPDPWRTIQVEAGGAGLRDPAAVGDKLIPDQHRMTRDPGHLFDGAVLVQPR
jgi:hypothetical protein